MSMPPSTNSAPLSGPCAGTRDAVDTRCAEAERLAQAALVHQQRLRDVKRQLVEVAALRESDARVRDRRELGAAKSSAHSAYHGALAVARDENDVHEAARVWLRDIDRLNRQVSQAHRRSEEVVKRASDLERSVPGVELAADAARIAAEAAQLACLEARRELAECEERAQQAVQLAAAAAAAASPKGNAPGSSPSLAPGIAPANASERGETAITLVLRGNRQALLSLALRLADETGLEAGRLQLLLLELRESIAARALEEDALRFPPDHPFWSQFPAPIAREVAGSLSSMGYRFDGAGGWVDGRAPTARELQLAISHVGLDPRGLRRPSGQEALDRLYDGTTVVVEEYLASRAHNLDLQEVMACLGPRAARLTELWDMWGRLRPLLLAAA
jgi:hypothetical protein